MYLCGEEVMASCGDREAAAANNERLWPYSNCALPHLVNVRSDVIVLPASLHR